MTVLPNGLGDGDEQSPDASLGRSTNRTDIPTETGAWHPPANRFLAEAAYKFVAHALHIGMLTRPKKCVNCGLACRPEAHHEDYFKPLEVIWLCKICHGLRHKKVVKKDSTATETRGIKIKAGNKQCPNCGEVKSTTEFYKNYKAPDGVHSKCIPCSRKIAQANREKKKQHINGKEG